MRGKKAKQIRKEVYGDFSFRHRSYSNMIKKSDEGVEYLTGAIIADTRRQNYQSMKKLFSNGIKFVTVQTHEINL